MHIFTLTHTHARKQDNTHTHMYIFTCLRFIRDIDHLCASFFAAALHWRVSMKFALKHVFCEWKLPPHGSIFFIASSAVAQLPKSDSPLTYGKFSRENTMLALGVCLLQPCSSAGPLTLRLDY